MSLHNISKSSSGRGRCESWSARGEALPTDASERASTEERGVVTCELVAAAILSSLSCT